MDDDYDNDYAAAAAVGDRRRGIIRQRDESMNGGGGGGGGGGDDHDDYNDYDHDDGDRYVASHPWLHHLAPSDFHNDVDEATLGAVRRRSGGGRWSCS